MRYFVPDLRLAAERRSKSGPVEKFGGQPWGLNPERWPKCSACGKSQSLIAQFRHAPERLDLGKEGRILYVFQCNHHPGDCPTWKGGSGANACFVVEPEDSTRRRTPRPKDAPEVENEAYIVGWVEREDGVPESEAPHFFRERAYYKLSDDLVSLVSSNSKLGGVPCWLQSPGESPSQADGWQFIGQIEGALSFLTPPATLPSWVSPDPAQRDGRTHRGQGPNFGGGGIGYLFIRSVEPTPEGWFFWQCG